MATSATPSSTRSLVAALGGGSGIHMAQLAADIANAQFAARADRLTAKVETLDRQISSASSLKNMLQGLASSLGERVRQGDLSPQPQLSNPAIARASLSGATPARGSFSLEVTALATAQTLASPAYAASTSLVGAGTLTLRFGTVAGSGFTADGARAPIAVAIPSGATLADVARAINASGAGVQAYVANAVGGAQLVLKGQTGAANGFVLEATETPGEEGVANLAWTPAAPPGRLLAGASDAALRLDGLAMISPGNTLVDVVPGVTLALTGTNSGNPAQLTFNDPSSAITGAMQDLTAALNEVAGELRKVADPQGGELSRDSGALALKRSFAGLAGMTIMPGAAPGAPRTLADLGLGTQRDGTFALDGKRLSASLRADPAGAAAMFTNGVNGVFAAIDRIARAAASAGDPGTLAGSIGRYTAQRARAGEDQARLTEQQEALRSRLTARFAVSDRNVGASRSTLSFLQNQIDAWNAQRN